MIKNIILTSAVDTENYKGIISIENVNNKTFLNLKTYNLPINYEKRILGIIIDGELYKVDVKEDENFIIEKNLNLSNKISVVLLEIENNKTQILIWGSNETSRVWKNSVLNKLDEKNNATNLNNEDSNLIDNHYKDIDNGVTRFMDILKNEVKEDDYETDEYIDDLVNKNYTSIMNDENDCTTFNSEINFSVIKEPEKELKTEYENTNNKSDFLNAIENQINELLNTYDEEKALEEIIPSSKFVKVDTEGNGNFYIFGVIYENAEIKYIVYGLPGEYSIKPDDEYNKFYQWLPLNKENPEGFGYYLMYQEANSGEHVEMIIQ